MKKQLLFIAFMLFSCINAFSQATSLTVDCQTPGWLSSMINYGDQQSLVNLKVTGYINGTDIQFIYDLNNRSLTGVIDLEDVSIVKGGTLYTNNYPRTIENDNEMPVSFFYDQKKPIQKFIYPQTLVKQPLLPFRNAGLVDSLIWTSTIVKSLDISNGLGCGNYVYLPEGIETIKQIPTGCKITLPNSITKVDYINQNIIVYSYITNPEAVDVLYETYNSIDGHQYWNAFANCTFYIPRGTLEKYLSSDFATKKTMIKNTVIPNGNTFTEYYDIERVELPSLITMYKGDSKLLEVNIYPDNTFVSSIDYISSQPNVATINAEGNIVAEDYGKTEISATPQLFIDGLETKTGKCVINVIAHVDGVQMLNSMSLHIGEEKSLEALTTPLNLTDNKIIYESDNPSIAEVTEEGLVKGKSHGKCTITGTSVDGGYTATCEVMVTQPVEGVTLNNTSITLKVGETEKLQTTVSPSSADNKKILWSSGNNELATVDAEGKVKALKAGEVTITATSEDNPNAKATCKVTVIQPVTGITLSETTYTLKGIGQSVQLTATVLPNDATNQKVNWKSSNENACIVSNGLVVSVGFGSAVIVATTEDGGFMSYCTVTVETETGIEDINLKETKDGKYYSIDGKRISYPQKGVSIVRISDGSSKKIILK